MGTLLSSLKKDKINIAYSDSTYLQKILKILFSVLMFFIGLMMIIPFIFMVSAAFKHTGEVFTEPLKIIPDELYWGNFQYLLHHKTYFIWYLNSIITVTLTILLRTFIVSTAAYSFARLKFRGKELLFFILISTMMITGDMTIIPRYLIYNSIGLIDSLAVIIIPSAFDVFFLFLLRQFFMKIPNDLSEAAIIDGCSHFKIYYKIIMPLAKPGLVTMILFTFIWTWNDYINPYIFITTMKTQVLTVGLQYFQGEAGANYSLQMAGASLAIIPTVILFIITQKYFIEGISGSGIKG
ncbi:carbohydrate ABC transporter permease [Vallitalea okinawensis]|uniref:carbohydrate ABC transporter permease n=1 Tax=Vallitalea okinawensis TaxID=2078660 RepID=UPI000CFC84EB|nr:carbohydrate ABC transporter permease [Vallitalea okinawensis]